MNDNGRGFQHTERACRRLAKDEEMADGVLRAVLGDQLDARTEFDLIKFKNQD